MSYNEDTLVQQTTADYLRDELGWHSVLAYNEETFGPEGTLGRLSDREIVLTRYLGEALLELNPGLPTAAYREAIRIIAERTATQSQMLTNRDKHHQLLDGVQVSFHNDKGELKKSVCAYSISTSQRKTISWWCASCGYAAISTDAAPTSWAL